MSACENILNEMLDGIAEADALKQDYENALRDLDKQGDKVRAAAVAPALTCTKAAFSRTLGDLLACSRDMLNLSDELSEHAKAFNKANDAKRKFKDKVAENHDRFNRMCFCLSLTVEGMEYGNQLENLEEQLENLEDELEEAETQAEEDEIEEEIEDIMDDLQFYDELLQEITEDMELEFE
jgi:DNA repair exonuclease SbcCD ATPase subunit